MQFAHALRMVTPSSLAPLSSQRGARSEGHCIAFVGAGGKTSALFLLARQLQSPVIVSASSHLGLWQTSLADRHIIAESPAPIEAIEHELSGVTLVTGPVEGDRTAPLNESTLRWLHQFCGYHDLPLLIEADGARQKPLKAPAAHEPPIPDFVDTVIVVAGLSALGQPLEESRVHRAETFSTLSGLPIGAPLTDEGVVRVLSHPQGGLKNIPANARCVALLNQANSAELQSTGGRMARELLSQFDSVLVGSLQQNEFQTFERTAAIILAAGEATRFGAPKQLLDWHGKPFVRQVTETALRAGLSPVVVVVGHRAPEVESALAGLPVVIAHNPNYAHGQASSIQCGLKTLPLACKGRGARGEGASGGAIFLLADQPQIPVEVLRALVETHAQSLPAILAPLVLNERRANPVLFDRVTFPDLLTLQGDVGGRAIFHKYKVEYLPWHDDLLLFDVDTPEDYQRLQDL